MDEDTDIKINRPKCEICGNTFADPGKLSRHKKEIHTDKTFECPICGIKVKRKETIKTHIKNVHEKVNTL